MPQHGSTIIFSKIPAGSYCSAGIAYRVTKGTKSYRFDRVDGSSGTSDPAWAVKQSVWSEA